MADIKKLRFGNREFKADVRYLSDMKDILYDKEWFYSIDNPENMAIYFMYRDLFMDEYDRDLIKKNNLRYDITIIPPFNLGCEYVKTMGHFHPNIPGSSLSFTEIYEVLEGRAHYLLQKNKNDDVLDVVLFEAKKGDKVIIPPNYGHITINPTKDELKMANWVSNTFSSEYEKIKKMGGGAYFELVDNTFIKNKNYDNLPELRKLRTKDFNDFGIKKGKDMYLIIREDPELLEFLNKPQDYIDIFDSILI